MESTSNHLLKSAAADAGGASCEQTAACMAAAQLPARCTRIADQAPHKAHPATCSSSAAATKHAMRQPLLSTAAAISMTNSNAVRHPLLTTGCPTVRWCGSAAGAGWAARRARLPGRRAPGGTCAGRGSGCAEGLAAQALQQDGAAGAAHTKQRAAPCLHFTWAWLQHLLASSTRAKQAATNRLSGSQPAGRRATARAAAGSPTPFQAKVGQIYVVCCRC